MSKMKAVYGEGTDSYSFKVKLKSGILLAWFIILTIICLLPIYILLVNATRSNDAISGGFSLIPGGYFGKNFDSMKNSEYVKPIFNALIGYKNSAIIPCSIN